jgi:pyruvate, orthophosphate dikinase
MGRTLGDPADPLLVSVRSGSKFSMPGMMDTILNIGLSDDSVRGLAKQAGNERFAWDSYRRLIQMFGRTVLGIDEVGLDNVSCSPFRVPVARLEAGRAAVASNGSDTR